MCMCVDRCIYIYGMYACFVPGRSLLVHLAARSAQRLSYHTARRLQTTRHALTNGRMKGQNDG